jgi:hypothetical protein
MTRFRSKSKSGRDGSVGREINGGNNATAAAASTTTKGFHMWRRKEARLAFEMSSEFISLTRPLPFSDPSSVLVVLVSRGGQQRVSMQGTHDVATHTAGKNDTESKHRKLSFY